MNLLLAMGIPTTPDDRGYFLWLSQHWMVFVLLTLALLALLTAWFIRTVHAWLARMSGPSGPPGPELPSAAPSSPTNSISDGKPEDGFGWPVQLEFALVG